MAKKPSEINPIELEVFRNRFAAICEEMGADLGRSAFSPNIKERRDYSCAVFDAKGQLVAQAAHIPVHLGSMALSVRAAIRAFRMRRGDTVILNDPYRGGTHLPDITLVAPVFLGKDSRPAFFVANRAHHSDVGGQSPGSMALASSLEDEGVVIPPTLLEKKGKKNSVFLKKFLKQVRRPEERTADLEAQLSANRCGNARLQELVAGYGPMKVRAAMRAYRRYEERITLAALKKIPSGLYRFEDFLDDDGFTAATIKIAVAIRVSSRGVSVDFSGSDAQVRGPVNATVAITYSATAYAFRCLVVALTGEDCLSMRPIQIRTRKGSVVDARYPAPVAGGNVETSQRLVDVLFGALGIALPHLIPAASQGTMNNVAFGNERFTYYETLAGGIGASPKGPGLNATHSHMTNTLNTPIEALENELPLRVGSYRLRRGSAGKGKFSGGEGLVREYLFLEDTSVSMLSDRRVTRPYGRQGGAPGCPGANWLTNADPQSNPPRLALKLPSKFERVFKSGETLRIVTPGGGGYGSPSPKASIGSRTKTL
ncbi:MAG: hydantoinase B/oxoprolinase family protein [Deltaproteobacteria bacterium]|nr:hydantoinase B/oxoprolinase family protein [Deltaproteobacteria bacterium]